MDRRVGLASRDLVALLALALSACAPAAAALPEATRSLYTQRLAANAAGRFADLAASPLVGVAPVPVLEDVVAWDRLRRESYQAPFAAYAGFLAAHPGWPQDIVLRRLAERAIDDSIGAEDRIAYFRRFPPLSATAKLRFAEALKATGRTAEANAMARDAWDSAGLDAVQETFLITLFGPVLTDDDHASRADRLLWSGQTSAASRLLPKLTVDRRLWLLARLALKANSPDAGVRLAAVPDALRNEPGLIVDRASWLRRNGDEAGARALLAATPVAPGLAVDPEAWLKARLEVARAAWRAGDFDTAYRIAAGHNAFPLGRGLDENPLGARQQFVETEFLAGWLALRKLNRATDAVRHFQNLRAASQTPLSQTRGDYWLGRAQEAAGQKEAARAAFEAAAGHGDTFYGQLAAERLGRAISLNRVAVPPPAPTALANLQADSLVRAATALGDIGDHGRQTLFLRALATRGDTAEQVALIASLATPLNRPDLAVLTAKNARGSGELAVLDAAFPQLPLPDSLASDAVIIHAISRQESQFDREAMSSAGARGLMQLLPSTAAEQAGKLGLEASTARLTSDPVYNVTLGSAYFNRLRSAYDGSHVLAVAAYNAGPGNVRRITAQIGRLQDSDAIDWIESIPIAETRNYVQRVLENAVVYEALRGGSPKLSRYLQ